MFVRQIIYQTCRPFLIARVRWAAHVYDSLHRNDIIPFPRSPFTNVLYKYVYPAHRREIIFTNSVSYRPSEPTTRAYYYYDDACCVHVFHILYYYYNFVLSRSNRVSRIVYCNAARYNNITATMSSVFTELIFITAFFNIYHNNVTSRSTIRYTNNILL